MRIAAHTLGCKLNSAETSTIVEQFRSRGWQSVAEVEADVFLLNTCSVTANAERECRQMVRRVLRHNPKAFVAVTGCYAQLRPEEIASIDGVDVVLGAKEKFDIFSHVSDFRKGDTAKIYSSSIDEATDYHFAATHDTDERTRAFLKVQDGCDYTCSYCTIPMARGESRSAEIAEVLAQARQLSASGFREIILSGVNVGDFGAKSGTSFTELVKALRDDDEVTARLRISSIEPNLLTEEIVEIVATNEKFCPHFHIPLQSGSAKLLRSMQRRYTAEHYRAKIEMVKELIPNAGIGVDVIVGFPAETDEDFRECYDFIHSLDVSYLHVFTYSERPGTKASEMGRQLPREVRKERNAMLRILSEKKRSEFYRSQVGLTGVVLMETEMNSGFTENYVRVELSERIASDSELVKVRYDALHGDVVVASSLEILSRREDHVLLPIVQQQSC